MTAIADDKPVIRAREVGSATDADSVGRALRHVMRWRSVGLVDAPDSHVFDEAVQVLWPERGARRLHAVLLFVGERLAALGIDFGWSDDSDRTRVAELVLLDDAVDAALVARAFTATLFTTALTLRARHGGALAATLPLGPTLVSGDSTFHHIARPAMQLDVPDTTQALDAATTQRIGAFGDGFLDARVELPPVTPPHRMYDPSTAHADLLRSSRMLRHAYYKVPAEVTDLEVAIIGGGIAGLTAAHALAPRPVMIFERETALGGTARAGCGFGSRFPLGAHYECDPEPNFSPELSALYENLGLTRRDSEGRHHFIDTKHYVPAHDYEQAVLANGSTRRRGWRMFFRDPAGMQAREQLLAVKEHFPMPTRLAEASARQLDRMTFARWLTEHQVELPPELQHSLDVLLRSDYAAPAATVSAFAGLHYFLCRPYLRGGSRTFSPPEGLAYFAERLFQRTPTLSVRARHMVRRVVPHDDHVTLEVADLDARVMRTYRALAVVYAAPKKQVKWVLPRDAHLFSGNAYAPWLTVTFEMERFRESAQLCWNNHVYDPHLEHIGFSWVNHADRDAPPVLTHYIAFEPGRLQHFKAFFLDPSKLIARCMQHVSAVIGREVSRLVKRVTIQKLGHAMAVPLPGKLFTDPNARRASPRVVYAGVDTGRLPILAEAFDSGLEAARLIGAL